MKLEDYSTYLGYILIGILLFLIIRTLVNKGKSKEGFLGLGGSDSNSSSSDSSSSDSSSSDSDDPAVKRIQANIDSLNDATKKTIDQMNLVKYRSHWEDLIVAMEDRISSESLHSANLLAAKMKSNPNDDAINQIIEKLNALNKYRETLKENMKYLDGLK
jgi:hypothetical protein